MAAKRRELTPEEYRMKKAARKKQRVIIRNIRIVNLLLGVVLVGTIIANVVFVVKASNITKEVTLMESQIEETNSNIAQLEETKSSLDEQISEKSTELEETKNSLESSKTLLNAIKAEAESEKAHIEAEGSAKSLERINLVDESDAKEETEDTE